MSTRLKLSSLTRFVELNRCPVLSLSAIAGSSKLMPHQFDKRSVVSDLRPTSSSMLR
jgi:hypothetical protein